MTVEERKPETQLEKMERLLRDAKATLRFEEAILALQQSTRNKAYEAVVNLHYGVEYLRKQNEQS